MPNVMTGLPDRLHVKEHVLFAELEDEIVLMNETNGVYYGLDSIGVTIWKQLRQDVTVREIFDMLLAAHDVEPETLAQDLNEFFADLEAHGLVYRSAQGGESGRDAMRDGMPDAGGGTGGTSGSPNRNPVVMS
jgi:hypothetical protein